jgi:hypothetical protein
MTSLRLGPKLASKGTLSPDGRWTVLGNNRGRATPLRGWCVISEPEYSLSKDRRSTAGAFETLRSRGRRAWPGETTRSLDSSWQLRPACSVPTDQHVPQPSWLRSHIVVAHGCARLVVRRSSRPCLVTVSDSIAAPSGPLAQISLMRTPAPRLSESGIVGLHDG